LWANSDNYNVVEGVHQVWLTSVCELLFDDENAGVHGIEF
jgi:hypothetical protein